MKRRTNIINNILLFVITMALMVTVILVSNAKYTSQSAFLVILYYLAGAIIFGLINAFVHEFGHVIAGKKNGFYITSFTVWFFRWTKVRGKYTFELCLIGEEAGYTESVPKFADNIEKRYKKMAFGGIMASIIMLVLSVVPFIFAGKLPLVAFCILTMSLPLSGYYVLGTGLPMISQGIKNDGAVVLDLNRKSDSSKVFCSILKIQSELFNGKTPSEIDEKLYFDVPQLPEDDINFAFLLDARYNYYVDKGDFDNAKKVISRLSSINEYLPKAFSMQIKANELYSACTFNYSEEKADELMYELEKFLNVDNTATTLRIKLAYLLYVKKEKEYADNFYNRAVKLAKKSQIKGLGLYETKLLDRLKEDF